MKKIERALISVSNKDGLIPLCKALAEHNIEIISTGGTKKMIEQAGLKVMAIDELTGFPEMLDGRVKTLHPFVHGGILAIRDNSEHQSALAKANIKTIDLVVVNLYPFKETLLKPGASPEDIIENIDIGGPTMIRSAAKNHNDVTVLCDPDLYDELGAELAANNGATSLDFRRKAARKAFEHTAFYDSMISAWFRSQSDDIYPKQISAGYELKQILRYGENPHQSAAFYTDPVRAPELEILQGKEMSYNNYLDLTGALDCAATLDKPGVVIIKHTNPCGVSVVDETGDLLAAFKRARGCDPVSAFGGIIAVNGILDEALAEEITQNFVEIVAAPEITDGAQAVFAKKKNLRLVKTTAFTDPKTPPLVMRPVYGGVLAQTPDTLQIKGSADFKAVTKLKPDATDLAGLLLAWQMVMNIKSNAIVFTDHLQTLGIGAGQMSRVDSVEIAVSKAAKAGLNLKGAYLASDAFFPFRDAVDRAAEVGVKAIVQPGGSIRDEEVIAACDEQGIIMVLSGYRHFRH